MNDLGLLLSRIAVGTSIAAHGAQKAFGAFDGPGFAGAAGFMESLGFAPGRRYAASAAWTEMASGAMIALGFGGAVGPAALISTMVVAQNAVHAKNGFFAQKGGVELGVIYGAAALALASAGFGRFSLDALLGWDSADDARLTSAAVVGAIIAGYVILGQRASAATTPASEASLAEGTTHIAAAREDRPVPADLMAPADEHPTTTN